VAILFDAQDEIVGQIVHALDLQLIDAEARRTFRERPDNPDARDLAVRGWSIMNNEGFLPQTCLQCADLFKSALAIERQNVRAMIGLSLAKARLQLGGWSDEDTSAQVNALVDAALRLEPQNTHAHFVKAFLDTRMNQQFEKGLLHFQKAIALNRSYANALVNIGFTKRFMGRPAECLPDLEKAFRLSPKDPQLGQWYRYYGSCLLDLRRYEQSIEWLYAALAADPSVEFVYRSLISALAHMGRMAEAHEHLAAYLKVRPVASIGADRPIAERMFHPSAADAIDHMFDGLRKAGLPD
jgi:adenylate cyclase